MPRAWRCHVCCLCNGRVVCVKHEYGQAFVVFSIPAPKHSTMTSWDHEKECTVMNKTLDGVTNDGIAACTSDRLDVHQACGAYHHTISSP